MKQRKRAEKEEDKLIGQCSYLVVAKDGKINDKKNGSQMKEYYRIPKEDVDSLGNSVNISTQDMPSLGDYLYAFLCD